MPNSIHEWLVLILWLLGSYAAAFLGATASVRAREFYRELDTPTWAPPPGVFGPVWTLLYTMMGIAAWMVWRAGGWSGAAKSALIVWIVQLALNALWSWLFFAWRRGALAVI